MEMLAENTKYCSN